LAAPSRHPIVTASFGATMQALYGPRLIVGLGRGVPLPDMPEYKIADLVSYARTLRALWAGESVRWQPPAGRDPVTLRTIDALENVPRPEVWYCTYGLPKAARACADEAFDGVMLYPFLTADAVRKAVDRIRNACADNGRDPDTLHICHPIVVANDLDDFTTRAYAHARAVTYLEWPGHGEALAGSNGWDTSLLTRLREHKQLRNTSADQGFHRAELMEPARLVPDELMEESCAIGSVEHCVERLQEYRDAGADEIAIYASTPRENARLVEAWRSRTLVGASSG
jgi:probable F420-dependent oxidoreductase